VWVLACGVLSSVRLVCMWCGPVDAEFLYLSQPPGESGLCVDMRYVVNG
jgi:hypothetical protein